MFQINKNKQGFTFAELMLVILILGILSAIAIPLYAVSLNKYRKSDCKNQIVIIEGHVQYVMNGMQDNGALIKEMDMTEGALHGTGDDKYWIITASYTPTIGNMRTEHLKKSRFKDVSFATLFSNSEIPVCPFDKEGTAGYRIYGDGHVECNCENCPNYNNGE